jgi:hypothetical protein
LLGAQCVIQSGWRMVSHVWNVAVLGQDSGMHCGRSTCQLTDGYRKTNMLLERWCRWECTLHYLDSAKDNFTATPGITWKFLQTSFFIFSKPFLVIASSLDGSSLSQKLSRTVHRISRSSRDSFSLILTIPQLTFRHMQWPTKSAHCVSRQGNAHRAESTVGPQRSALSFRLIHRVPIYLTV